MLQATFSVPRSARVMRTTLRRLGRVPRNFIIFSTSIWLICQLAWLQFSSIIINHTGGILDYLTAWDGQWYLSIATNGYQSGPILDQANVAFFPLYPLLISILHSISIPAVAASLALSLAAFVAYLFVFYRLVCAIADRHLARWTIIIQLCLPFSFYYISTYTESLFLFLTASFFLLLIRQHLYAAAVVASLASVTRLTGVFLGVVLVVFVLLQAYQQRQHLKAATILGTLAKISIVGMVSISGLLAFMVYMWRHTGDPLAFISVQQYWGRAGGVLNHVNELKRASSELARTNPTDLIFVAWYGMTAAGLAACLVLVKRHQQLMAFFLLLIILVPLASGTVTSMNRYVIGAMPFALALAWLTHRWRYRWVVAFCSVVVSALYVYILTLSSTPLVG
jgi:Mannosyltransferase (PIG-V)